MIGNIKMENFRWIICFNLLFIFMEIVIYFNGIKRVYLSTMEIDIFFKIFCNQFDLNKNLFKNC